VVVEVVAVVADLASWRPRPSWRAAAAVPLLLWPAGVVAAVEE
jgi:hypothetical protein